VFIAVERLGTNLLEIFVTFVPLIIVCVIVLFIVCSFVYVFWKCAPVVQ